MNPKNPHLQELHQEKARQLVRENETIAEIGKIISETYEIESVYGRFAREARKLIPFDRISINLINPDGRFTTRYIAGLSVKKKKVGDVYLMDGSVMEEVVQSHAGQIIHPKTLRDLKNHYPYLIPNFRSNRRHDRQCPALLRL